jgi:hypothetical protein
MILRVCLSFFPLLVIAQDQAPPAVDQDLRARVSGFYQNFLEGSWSPRKAENFIAEDTKDYFYNAAKLKFISFRIDKITYSDSFTKATVVVVGKGTKMVAGHPVVLDQPMDTRWKIEDGKWCWTYSPYEIPSTPMGGKLSPPDPALQRAGVEVPKSVAPEDIKSAGAAIVGKTSMGVDKSRVTMSADQPSSVQVIFTNGAGGEVLIGVDGPTVRGLTAKLDKTSVPAHGTALLTLQYDPAAKSALKDIWEPKGRIPLRIVVGPFNRVYPIDLEFIKAK